MKEKYPKNSLLGQLEQNGIIKETGNEAEYLPFGTLSKGFENSPFAAVSDAFEKPKIESKIMQKRLNETDQNIFLESNFLNIEDSELTDKEKMLKIKLLIKKLDEKIYMLEDSDDKILIGKLNDEKEALVSALNLLSGANKELDLSKNLFSMKTDLPVIQEIAKKIHLKEKIKAVEKIIFTLCPPLKKNFLVRKALSKLVMLNESTKELLVKQIPYGESEVRYNDFIAYLSCANIIHTKLTKKM